MTVTDHRPKPLATARCGAGATCASRSWKPSLAELQRQREVLQEIGALRDRGAVFFLNHSAGKDSQAMTIVVRQLVPADQIVVIHSHLPGMEWPGTIEHIYETVGDVEVLVTRAIKTFADMVNHRGRFPSPTNRQCTSDLKRGPIEREIRRWMKARGKVLAVSCLGLRAEESSRRSKADVFKRNTRLSKAGREVFDWLPVHGFSTAQVFQTIYAAGQAPHWAYTLAGASRLSCALCIMASRRDLAIGAVYNPAVYRQLAGLERKHDQTMLMPGKGGMRRFLDELIPEAIGELAAVGEIDAKTAETFYREAA